jgi:hypothetical protein
LWYQVSLIVWEQACKQIATLGSLLLSLLIIIDDRSGQTRRRDPNGCSLTGSPAKPLQPASPQLVPGPISIMFLLKFLALGLPVRLGIVEFFPHNSGLLSTSKGKIPEYLIDHLEHANAEQWNLLKGFPILPQPANKTYSKYAKYANMQKYTNM